MKPFSWIVSAALAAYACHLAVHHATPVDRALPLLAVVVTVCAAVSYREVMIGVVLLIAASIAIPDESLRLLTYGVIIAVSFAAALWKKHELHVLTTVAAIVVLRWIPFEDVRVVRELALIAVCAAIVLVLRRTPFAVAIAIVTALITPAVPLRTLAVPLLVLFVAMAARAFGMPRFEWRWLSTAAVAFVMLFFAWSGVVARAFPYFLRKAYDPPLYQVDVSLKATEALTLEVPAQAKALVLSGANVIAFERGTLLGRIEPGGIDVRIGDASDWGAFRREHAQSSRNPLPRNPAGSVHGYGYSAWLDGAGRLPLPPGARTIRVIADASLPANASLLIEGFELE
ncbi:MAG TPA: hypothetical protein VE010_20420 [Thermoanaerobaculia bacterium]|nr:hypothetical protein [Thermoanaerobaculia bacterium]